MGGVALLGGGICCEQHAVTLLVFAEYLGREFVAAPVAGAAREVYTDFQGAGQTSGSSITSRMPGL
jgi:hypothetical protein